MRLRRSRAGKRTGRSETVRRSAQNYVGVGLPLLSHWLLLHQLFNDLLDHPVVRFAIDFPFEQVALSALGIVLPAEGHVRIQIHAALSFRVPIVTQSADSKQYCRLIRHVPILRLAAEPEGISSANRVFIRQVLEF